MDATTTQDTAQVTAPEPEVTEPEVTEVQDTPDTEPETDGTEAADAEIAAEDGDDEEDGDDADDEDADDAENEEDESDDDSDSEDPAENEDSETEVAAETDDVTAEGESESTEGDGSDAGTDGDEDETKDGESEGEGDGETAPATPETEKAQTFPCMPAKRSFAPNDLRHVVVYVTTRVSHPAVPDGNHRCIGERRLLVLSKEFEGFQLGTLVPERHNENRSQFGSFRIDAIVVNGELKAAAQPGPDPAVQGPRAGKCDVLPFDGGHRDPATYFMVAGFMPDMSADLNAMEAKKTADAAAAAAAKAAAKELQAANAARITGKANLIGKAITAYREDNKDDSEMLAAVPVNEAEQIDYLITLEYLTAEELAEFDEPAEATTESSEGDEPTELTEALQASLAEQGIVVNDEGETVTDSETPAAPAPQPVPHDPARGKHDNNRRKGGRGRTPLTAGAQGNTGRA
jgi:hypothetical protein